MAISKRTRFEVLRRDNHTCRYCRATDAPLTIDHVTPVALGGSDDPSNLVTACRDCNAGKSSTSPDEGIVADVADDAIRWAAAMKEAARRRNLKAHGRHADISAFCDYWVEMAGDADLPVDWESSVNKFLDAGLTMGDLKSAVNLAVARVSPWSSYRYFRYFAGVCWNYVRDLQAEAQRIIEAEAD